MLGENGHDNQDGDDTFSLSEHDDQDGDDTFSFSEYKILKY